MRVLQNTVARPVAGLTFAADGLSLAAGGNGGFDHWSLVTGERRFFPFHATKYLWAFTFDPRGRWLYVSDSRGGYRLYPLPDGPWRRLPGSQYDHHVISLAVSPDGGRLAVSRGGAGTNRLECWAVEPDGTFRAAWSVQDGQPIDPGAEVRMEMGRNGFVHAVAVSPDGRTVAAVESSTAGGGWDKPRLILRAADTGTPTADLEPGPGAVGLSLAYTPDGRTLLAWCQRWIEVRDVAGRHAGRIDWPGRSHLRGLAVLPRGRGFITASGDWQARLWDLDAGKVTRAFKWDVGKLHAAAVSPDGATAAVGGDKGRVVVWDLDL
jgi:WD40 repeat protein